MTSEGGNFTYHHHYYLQSKSSEVSGNGSGSVGREVLRGRGTGPARRVEGLVCGGLHWL